MIADEAPEVVLEGGRPIDEQIREQLRAHILAGRLAPGDQLPSVRALAVGLAVRPDAVRTALDLLEREGYLTTAEGSGIFVAGPPAAPADPARKAELGRLCREFLAEAWRRGFTPAEVRATVSAYLEGDEP
jgi:DNA-binding transcriptional regulator YhcF (GntR family)